MDLIYILLIFAVLVYILLSLILEIRNLQRKKRNSDMEIRILRNIITKSNISGVLPKDLKDDDFSL